MFHFLAIKLTGGLEGFFPALKPFKPSFAITHIAFLFKKCLPLICT